MTGDTMAQTHLRNKLADLARQSVEHGELSIAEAAVACWGASTVFLGCLKPGERERACEHLDGMLLEHANKRARELRSGEFDAQDLTQ